METFASYVPDPAALALFAVGALVAWVGALIVSGASARTPSRAAMLVSVGVLAVLILTLGGLAVSALTWPAGIIVGGLTLIAAPLVFQAIPSGLADGRAGYVMLCVAGLGLSLLAAQFVDKTI